MNAKAASRLALHPRLAAEQFRYRRWRKRQGLDFGHESIEALGLDPEHSVHYENGGGPALAKVLRRLNIAPSDYALDLGCGKGGALATLAGHFRRVDGVEISPRLCEIARHNLALLKLSRTCRVIEADARQLTDLDRYTHLFLYNPFSAQVLWQVLDNLVASLARRPRPVTIVYAFPRHQILLEARGFHRLLSDQSLPGHTISVFTVPKGESK